MRIGYIGLGTWEARSRGVSGFRIRCWCSISMRGAGDDVHSAALVMDRLAGSAAVPADGGTVR